MAKISVSRDFHSNRSDKYQYILLELSVCDSTILQLSDESGIFGIMNHEFYHEELFLLLDQLKQAYWRLINTKLTKRQREVITLYAKGHTQTEIAQKLGVNQSSITKSIHGNVDYRNGKRVYGGAKKKLEKYAEQDLEIIEILRKIAEIQSEMAF